MHVPVGGDDHIHHAVQEAHAGEGHQHEGRITPVHGHHHHGENEQKRDDDHPHPFLTHVADTVHCLLSFVEAHTPVGSLRCLGYPIHH